MNTIISAFLLIFFAEIGDKTQFLALIFASQYKLYQVILGIFIGIFLNHSLAVLIAEFLSSIVNIEILKIIAGIMFLLFSFESFIQKNTSEDSKNTTKKMGAILTVAICFFLGELGDKTQITAMSMVFTGKNPFLVLVGTTLGMLCVNMIGVLLGRFINNKLSMKMMSIISGVCFMLFAVEIFFETIPKKYINFFNISMFLLFIMIIFIGIYLRNKRFKNKTEKNYD